MVYILHILYIYIIIYIYIYIIHTASSSHNIVGYVVYKPWPRGVYICRYTPACEEFFVIFSESRRLEGYITNTLLNISRCIADIYTKWPWFICYVEVR